MTSRTSVGSGGPEGRHRSERTIGQLAVETGFTPKTIRYYEAIGLLPEPRRRPSGYRMYDERARQRLTFVERAKRLGLSLDEIRGVLVLHETGTEPCLHVRSLLDAQIARVDDALEQLTAFRRQLVRLRSSTPARSENAAAVCRIVEHSAIDVSPPQLPALAPRRRRVGR